MILLLEWSLGLCNEWIGTGACVLRRNRSAGFCRAILLEFACITVKRWLQTNFLLSSHLVIGL